MILIIEGLVHPVGLLKQTQSRLNFDIHAFVESPWNEVSVTPEDGVFIMSEREKCHYT